MMKLFNSREVSVHYGPDIGSYIALDEHVLSDEDVVRLGCGLASSKVFVRKAQARFSWNGRNVNVPSIHLESHVPDLLAHPLRRRIFKASVNGTPTYMAYNEHFELLPTYQGSGIGKIALALQIRAALQCNVRYLLAYAAGSKGSRFRGYWIWPHLGYDGRIPNHIWARLPPDEVRRLGLTPSAPERISTLLERGGGNLWRHAGEGFNMYFSVNAGRPEVARLFNLLRRVGL